MIKKLRMLLFALAATALALMVAALFIQVLAREFRWPVDWSEELGRFSFITMVFIAAAYSTLHRSHLRVTIFSDLLAKHIGTRAVELIHAILLLGFSAFMLYYSGINFIEGLRYPNISPAIGFNQNYLFIAMCLGFTVIFLLHLRDAFILINKGELND